MDTVEKYARELVPGDVLMIYVHLQCVAYTIISVSVKEEKYDVTVTNHTVYDVTVYGHMMSRNAYGIQNWILNPSAVFVVL